MVGKEDDRSEVLPNAPSPSNPLKLAYIEDQEFDSNMLKEEFEKLHIQNELKIYKTAQSFLDIVLADTEGNIPDILFLDLNLPGMDGFSFLRKIREYQQLDSIKIFVMTVSTAESDIKTSFALKVAGYFPKPPEIMQILVVLTAAGLKLQLIP